MIDHFQKHQFPEGSLGMSDILKGSTELLDSNFFSRHSI